MGHWTWGVVALGLLVGCGARGPAPGKVSAAPPAAEKRLDLVVIEKQESAAPAAILGVLDAEMQRTLGALRGRQTPPYFLAYQVTERQSVDVLASYGAVIRSDESHRRVLDVDLRVGDYQLDSSHPLRSGDYYDRFDVASEQLPLDGGDDAVRVAIWSATNQLYGQALDRFVRVKADRAVKVAEEDRSDDFSREKPTTSIGPPAAAITLDRAAWAARLKAHSALFRSHPEIHESSVQLSESAVTRWLVTSEGSRVQSGQTLVRVNISAQTTAEDGMRLWLYDSIDAFSDKGLPDDREIGRRVRALIARLIELRRAPPADAFVGPAILEGHAAGVYFHEIFGHRMEGHRQKNEDEGQTFTRKIDTPVMPAFVHVYDDPRAASMNGVELNGHYLVDDEGVPARRAALVERGILKGFLMSRSPVRGFDRSNGHGRRQEGSAAVARQGNLIVDPDRVVSPAELKRRLIAEVKRQHKPYGLRFVRVEGGYTNTRRGDSQSFKVLPILVYRVYPDGREEMIRGADLEGTPLTSLSKILAAGGDFAVFNGYCGAESGYVPVSAISPSLLVEQVEIARKEKGQDKPPLLPPPPTGAAR